MTQENHKKTNFLAPCTNENETKLPQQGRKTEEAVGIQSMMFNPHATDKKEEKNTQTTLSTKNVPCQKLP